MIACLICTICGSCPITKADPRPLGKTELLALVAANVLPENIASEIRSYGLDFKPDDAYNSLLKSAGADPKVFAALAAATTKNDGKPDRPADTGQLQHLSNAGKLIRTGHFDGAVAELTASLASDSDNPASGFVMGDILIKQKRFEAASQVYSEILRKNPDFPEVHTRLRLTYNEDPKKWGREMKPKFDAVQEHQSATN